MNDPLLVRGLERVRDLTSDRDRLGHRYRSPRDPAGQRFAFHKLQHQRADAAAFLDAVDRGDVRMLEGGEGLRLALEPRETVRVGRNGLRENLERDIALEPRVVRSIDLSHAARSQGGDDLVRPNADTRTERHQESTILHDGPRAATPAPTRSRVRRRLPCCRRRTTHQ